MPLSEDLRAELAAIAPTRGCDRLAELSALFHSAGQRPPPRARRDRAPPRPRELRRSPGARSRSCARSGSSPRSGPTGAARSTGRRATSSTSRGTTPRSACSSRRACSRPARAARAAAEAGRRPRVLPRRLPPRRVPRRRLALGPALAAPRAAARPRSRAPRSSLRRRRRATRPSAVLERGRHAVAYAKSWDAIEARARRCRRRRDGARARGARGRRRDARARQTGSRTPITRTSSARAGRRRSSSTPSGRCSAAGALERLPDRLHEVARLRLRHPTLSLRELAAKCDPPSTKASVHRRLKKLAETRRRVFRLVTRVTSAVFALVFEPGGSTLVRRRIQTPSVAGIRARYTEGKVVLGASPPARLHYWAQSESGSAGADLDSRQDP